VPISAEHLLPQQVFLLLVVALLAEEHQWVPNSGWVTFRVRSDNDLQHAIWLMRLSYFQYALKTAVDPRKLFAEANHLLEKLSLQ